MSQSDSFAKPKTPDSVQEFEQLGFDDMEAAMTMSVSDAMFTSVLSSYPIGAHIQCRCQVTDRRNLEPGCWIGLFKVGWSDAKEDCVCRAECRADADDKMLVAVFSQTLLPNDTNNFFQFCFVAPDGIVKGASSPFTFRQSPADDFVAELDEELQGVVVTARNAELENELASMRMLQSQQREEAEIRQRKLDELTGRLSSANRLLRDKSGESAQLEAKLKETTEALLAAEARGDEAEAKAAFLQSEAADLNARLTAAQMERDQLAEKASRLQEQLDTVVGELEAARSELELKERETEEAAERLEVAKREAADAEKRERVSNEQLRAVQSDLAELRRRHEEVVDDKDRECRSLRAELSSLRESDSEQMQQLRARSGSLLIAYNNLKGRCLRAEERDRVARQKYDEVIRINRQLLAREEKLSAKVRSLQDRLSEGAVEYKKLLARGGGRGVLGACEEAGDEFHDARSDEQSLIDLGAQEEVEEQTIYRPPGAEEAAAAAEEAMETTEEAAETPASISNGVCPMCGDKFAEQDDLERHVNGHFTD